MVALEDQQDKLYIKVGANNHGHSELFSLLSNHVCMLFLSDRHVTLPLYKEDLL